MSEDRLSLGLVMPQTIADNTVISVLDRLTGRLGLIDGARRAQTIDHWIFKELHVKTKTADRPVQQLSGGNQQRVVLAKWLATDPRVLILDSPTVGVDIGAKAGIFQVVDALAARGLAILLISDEADEVLYQSHRILVMRSGQIVGDVRYPARQRARTPGGHLCLISTLPTRGCFTGTTVQLASIVVRHGRHFLGLSPGFLIRR